MVVGGGCSWEKASAGDTWSFGGGHRALERGVPFPRGGYRGDAQPLGGGCLSLGMARGGCPALGGWTEPLGGLPMPWEVVTGRCPALEGIPVPWGGYGGSAQQRGGLWGNAWSKEGSYGGMPILGERLRGHALPLGCLWEGCPSLGAAPGGCRPLRGSCGRRGGSGGMPCLWGAHPWGIATGGAPYLCWG